MAKCTNIRLHAKSFVGRGFPDAPSMTQNARLRRVKYEKQVDAPYYIGYTEKGDLHNMTREFVRLPEFEKQCKHIGLSEDDVMAIEILLLDNPTAGELIKGTGGIRKLRFALEKTGKRGGARVIYIDFASYEKTYLITTYAKSKTENLTKAERNELKSLVSILKSEMRKKG